MLTGQELSSLISAIYDCATDPRAWEFTLEKINRATRCRAATVGIVSFETQYSLLNATAGFDDGFRDRYASNMSRLSAIWGGNNEISARPVHEPVVQSFHHPDSLLRGGKDHTLLSNVLGFDVEDTLTLPLANVGSAIGSAAFARERGQGVFEPPQFALFRLLSPHLSRSAEINRLLQAQTLSMQIRDKLIDQLRAPVLIVNSDLRIVYANSHAQSLLSSALRGLLRRDQCGTLVPSKLTTSIRHVISGSRAYEWVTSGTGEFEPRPCSYHVMLLRERLATGPCEYAAVVATPMATDDATWVQHIADAHCVTTAEATVLLHLLNGATTRFMADALRLQQSTVRTHVLKVFEKFDVHSRAELIAHVKRLTPPFALPLHQMVDDSRLLPS